MRFVACLLLGGALAACSSSTTSSTAGKCEGFSRLPSHEGVAFWWRDGKSERIAADCGDSTCLRSNPDTVEIVQRDGSIWSLSRGAVEAPQVFPREAPPKLTVEGFPPAPTLPPELRACGVTHAGGGYGYMVIANDTNTWQRVAWAKPPLTDDVKALGPAEYPIAAADGSLCAVATQTAPRMWRAHLVRANKDVDLKRDTEHPAASCGPADAVTLEKAAAGGAVAVAVDGSESPAPPPGGPVNTRLSVVDRRTVHDRAATSVLVERKDKNPTPLALPVDKDLGGRALPPGTVREQVLAAGDGDHRLLVAERLRLPDCSVREALTLVDVDDATKSQPIATGDVVYTRLGYALDRFVWVEAPPQVEAP